MDSVLIWVRDVTYPNHTIIGVFIGFVCLSTPLPFMGPWAPNLAGRLGTGAESVYFKIIIHHVIIYHKFVQVRVRAGTPLARH